MPIVEDIPHIDPSVKHIGVSKLRGLNADKLRDTKETFVIQENDRPLAVLLTYEKYLAIQERLAAVANVISLLSDPVEVQALKSAIADIKAGRIESLTSISEELKIPRG
jgi:PHD/YefM family antitoxin component YafN of YafNO toxin-antitoxin module